MSIIDEEWTLVDLGDIHNSASEDSFPFLEQGSCFDGAAHTARARLAAQAPAMARLLLYRMGDRNCEYCGVKVDRTEDTTLLDPQDGNEPLVISRASVHGRDCALVACLRAAGVVE